MTEPLLSLYLLGAPVGKGRPKFARLPNGKVTTRTPDKTRRAEGAIEDLCREEWGDRPPLDEPLALDVVIVGARPKNLLPKSMGGSAPVRNPPPSGRMWRPTKPDGDNVLKLIADGLKAAWVIRDDTRIVVWRARCVYAALDEGAHVEVSLWPAPDIARSEAAGSALILRAGMFEGRATA